MIHNSIWVLQTPRGILSYNDRIAFAKQSDARKSIANKYGKIEVDRMLSSGEVKIREIK